MKLNLYIKMHTPAFDFDDRPGYEAARILRDLAERIEAHPNFSEGLSMPLLDHNGTEVGNMHLTHNEWQDEPDAQT